MRLTHLWRYPMKSGAGEALASAVVGEEGLEQDRRFVVVAARGKFVTARTHPQLQRLSLREQAAGHWQLAHLDRPEYGEIAFATDLQAERLDIQVWADQFTALSVSDEADAWLSEQVGMPVRLLWLGEQSTRYREVIDQRVSAADAFPLLLASESSLAALNTDTPTADHGMNQFRPNLVISGAEAWAEDHWKEVRVGEVRFRLVSSCTRCAMVNVDPATGLKRDDKEPLTTLARVRRFEDGQVHFGYNLVALDPTEGRNTLHVGDDVEVMA
ncbi:MULTISPECIES: MOSC domain-containing protein [Cobetia]|uniref:MOSC domain-containing protein n=1 Tax=Cobetia crustatorum TaxID=553385 RepID=A0A558HF98_9GAMM|nr:MULTISPECIES: MOSC N-terminal beta barrel domain-containing protein [Cobetia]TVU67815.1 MOSC domain-containing protein [Cobetia crustatorum]